MGYIEDMNKIKFDITDTGIGISRAKRDEIFSMFGKLEEKISVSNKGIGLGLNVAQSLVSVLTNEKEKIQFESECE